MRTFAILMATLASRVTMSRCLHTMLNPTKRIQYTPPSWASEHLVNLPKNRLHLANLPTPVYRILPTNNHLNPNNDRSPLQLLWDLNISLLIKRDDMSGGVELGGNKVRKLEFLLADALEKGYDSVVTIGGEQSNHCRATAAACRTTGLEPHLILRTKRANKIYESNDNENENKLGYIGNILFDRMVGSQIYTCTPGEYGRVGSHELVHRLCKSIEQQGEGDEKRKVYPIPVGGSNGLGSWGYVAGVQELMEQMESVDEDENNIDHVVFACGSGGTAAGITLGIALGHGALSSHDDDSDYSQIPSVHAVGVCDDPDYFYKTVSQIADEMGLNLSGKSVDSTEDFIRRYLIAHQGKGLGYASSTQEELDFVAQIALETGIALDPVYSGKALYHFVTSVLPSDPEKYRDSTVLFWHTGGALGLYDKCDALDKKLSVTSPVKRLDVYGSGSTSGKFRI